MVYHKYQRTKHSRFGLATTVICYKCGTTIELGEVFYSKITKRHGENFIRHFCEDCYEKQFVTV